jgi:Na+/H+ antiporter NhaD/arsenite permease-like protein
MANRSKYRGVAIVIAVGSLFTGAAVARCMFRLPSWQALAVGLAASVAAALLLALARRHTSQKARELFSSAESQTLTFPPPSIAPWHVRERAARPRK